MPTATARSLRTKDDMKDPTSPLTAAIASFNAAKRSKLSDYTKAWYKNAFEGFLEWLAQNGREGVLRDLDPEIVTQYLDYRLDHGRRVKQLPSGERVRTGKGSAHQARQAAVALKSLASYLAKNGVWHDEHERAVLHAVEFPEVRDVTRDELTAEEIAKGLTAARQSLYPDRDQAILQFILGEGTRLNETRLLRVGDVDFENAIITVRAETAKYNRKRIVTLWPEVAETLDRYLATRDRVSAEQPLFPRDTGDLMTLDGFKKLFRRIAKRAGMEHRLTAHYLRHTAVSAASRAGTYQTPEQRDRAFGWRDARMGKRYDHVDPVRERLARPSPFGGLRRGGRYASKSPDKQVDTAAQRWTPRVVSGALR